MQQRHLAGVFDKHPTHVQVNVSVRFLHSESQSQHQGPPLLHAAHHRLEVRVVGYVVILSGVLYHGVQGVVNLDNISSLIYEYSLIYRIHL